MNSYRVRVSINGKKHRGTFPTREQAEQFEAELLQRRLKKISNQYEQKIPFGILLDEWLNNIIIDVSPSTRKNYIDIGHRWLDSLKTKQIADIEETDFKLIIPQLKEKAPSLIAPFLFIAREVSAYAIAKYGKKQGHFNFDLKNLSRHIPKRNFRIEFITEQEIKIIHKLLEKENGKILIRTKNMLILLVSTGLRIGELASLTRESIDFHRRTLQVKTTLARCDRAETGKTWYIKDGTKSGDCVYRTIPLSNPAINALKELYARGDEYNKKYNCNNIYVITPQMYDAKNLTKPINRENLAKQFRMLQRYLEKRGVKLQNVVKLTPHVCRHSFATIYLKKSNGNVGSFRTAIMSLQKILGHSSLETTMKYVHLINSEQDCPISIMDDLIGGPN